MVVTNVVVVVVNEYIDLVVSDVGDTDVVEITNPVGIKVENVLSNVLVVV